MEAEDRPFLGRGHLDIVDHAASVHGDRIALRAALDPLDRATRRAREREAQCLLGVNVQLAPERTSDVGRDDPELVLGDAGRTRERDPRDVWDLRRGPEGELAHGRHGRCDRAARLDRARGVPRRLEAELQLDRGGVEQALVAPPAVAPVDHAVRPELLVHQRSVLLHRGLHVEDGGEGFVLDVDRLGRVIRLTPRLGHDDRDPVALEPGLVLRQGPVVRRLDVLGDRPDHRQRPGPRVRQVGATPRPHHARHLERFRDIDVDDAGVRERAPDEGHVCHARNRHVVDEAPLPLQQRRVLLAEHGLPDEPLGGRHLDLLRLRPGRLAGGVEDRLHDVVVAGATTEVALE